MNHIKNWLKRQSCFFDYVCNNGLDAEKIREGADGHEGAIATCTKTKATIYEIILEIVAKRVKTQQEYNTP